MDFSPQPRLLGTVASEMKSAKQLAQDALDINKKLQHVLTQRAEQLETELKEAEDLLAAASVEEGEEDPEPEVSIPGAKKASGLFPPSEFLNPNSPFYKEAIKRSTYMTNTQPHPMKVKDLETLAKAVRQENERLQAYKKSHVQGPIPQSDSTINFENNIEELDWTRIAEKVSDASSVKRSATECRIVWVSDRHPRVNHAEWSTSELERLCSMTSEYLQANKKVDWVQVAKSLGTNRTPIDCMRHGTSRPRHLWTEEADQKLISAVESCGIDNWPLVARKVSENVTGGQCQGRWQKSLNPRLKRGAWTEEEDQLLRKAVAGFGSSWIQVATAIPGRTNDQCRERWTEHVKLSASQLKWTEGEDKILMDSVKELGNHWKAISFKIGNNKTGPSCRLRYDKLRRLDKRSPSSTPGTQSSVPALEILPIAGPSRLILPQNGELQTATLPANTAVETPPNTLDFDPSITTVLNSRPKPKPRAKGKRKASASDGDPTPQTPFGAEPLATLSKKSRKSTKLAARDMETGSTTAAQEFVGDGTVPEPERRSNKADALADTTDVGSLDAEASVAVAAPKERPKPRPKPKKGDTVGVSTVESVVLHGVVPTPTPGKIATEHETTSNQNAQSIKGRKRKANSMEDAAIAPPSKKARAVKQPRSMNEISGVNTTTEVGGTSVAVDTSPGNPGPPQLRRGRSHKGLTVSGSLPAEPAPADAATNDATATVKRGRGRPRKSQVIP